MSLDKIVKIAVGLFSFVATFYACECTYKNCQKHYQEYRSTLECLVRYEKIYPRMNSELRRYINGICSQKLK